MKRDIGRFVFVFSANHSVLSFCSWLSPSLFFMPTHDATTTVWSVAVVFPHILDVLIKVCHFNKAVIVFR